MTAHSTADRASRTVATGGLVNMLGNVIGVVQPLFLLIVARLLGADILGLFVVAMESVALLLRLGVLGLDKGLLRHIPIANHTADVVKTQRSVVGTALKVMLGLSVVITGLVFFLPALLLEHTGSGVSTENIRWLRLLVLAVPAEAAMRLFLFALRGTNRMAPFVIVANVVHPGVSLALGLGLIALGLGGNALIIAYIAAGWTGALCSWWLFRRAMPDIGPIWGLIRAPLDPDILSFSWPQGLTDLLNMGLARVDILMLGYFFPAHPEYAGVYAIASKLAGLVKKPRVALDISLGPVIADLMTRHDAGAVRETYDRVSRWIHQLYLAIACGVTFGAAFVLGLFGPEFAVCWYLVPILAGSRFFNMSFGPAQMALLMSGRSRLELANNIAINIGNVALNLFLIQWWGMLGAAIATATSLTVFNIVRVVQVRVILGLVPPIATVVRTTLAAVVACVPATFLLASDPIDSALSLAAALVFAGSYVFALYLFRQQRDIEAGLGTALGAWGTSRAGRRVRAWINLRLAALRGQAGRIRRLPVAMAVTRMSAIEVENTQVDRLRSVLQEAGAHVPYWRDLFATLDFDPDAVDSVEDIASLPILTKEIIRAEGDRMMSDGADSRRVLVRTTGGSTGKPLTFRVAREEYEAQLAINLRAFQLVGVSPGDGFAKIWGYGKRQRIGNLLAPLTGRLYFDAFHTAPADLDRWYAAMRRIRPKAIYGYAGALHLFAKHVESRGGSLPGLKVIASTAEKLLPEARDDIERALGARVFDMYGAHEVTRLASECRYGRMHVHPDSAVLEFVPDPDDPDGPQRILVTSLLSAVQPFIRYDIGDAGKPGVGPCQCGLHFPTMSMDVGKQHLVFELPDGERLHTSFFFQKLYPIDALEAFQIRQVALDHIEVVAIPAPQRTEEASNALDGALETFRERLGDGVTVDWRFVDEIPLTPRGKRPFVVSLVER